MANTTQHPHNQRLHEGTVRLIHEYGDILPTDRFNTWPTMADTYPAVTNGNDAETSWLEREKVCELG